MSAIIETDWSEIYINYFDKIFHYIKRRVRYVDVCEELTSETFVKAIEATQKGTGAQSHFNGWLYRIAHNLIVDHYRVRDRIQEEPLEYAGHLHAERVDPFIRACSAEDRDRVKWMLRQLKEDQRRVIVLRFGYGMDFKEIGQEMGRTSAAAKALQHRAFVRANAILRGDTERITPTRKPNCVEDIANAIREHGPMTVRQICEVTGRGYVTVGVVIPRTPDVFVKVDEFKRAGNTVYVWDLVGGA